MDRIKESSHDEKQSPDVEPIHQQSPDVVPMETPPKKIEMPMAPIYPPMALAATKAAHQHYKMMMFINHKSCKLKQQTPPRIQIRNRSPLKMNNDSSHQRDGGGK